MKEKEAQFNDEKNCMWKELTEAFQKVILLLQNCGITFTKTAGMQKFPFQILLVVRSSLV